MISTLKNKVLSGHPLTEDEAYSLCDFPSLEALLEASAEVTRHYCTAPFKFCSIINARSGRCSENCAWCAQSAHFKTSAPVHGIPSRDEILEVALHNQSKGVARFSLVVSGRSLKGDDLETVCSDIAFLRSKTKLGLCGSLGLLDRESLHRLHKAGLSRYHCNLETAPSYFGKLCSTHSLEDKIKTLEYAREEGLEICSGGIIGMGETPSQRVEFALELRRVEPCSIPVNILSPIPGTPLEAVPPISDEDILRTIAIFRLIHPRAELRLAGGRSRLSKQTLLRARDCGITGAITGDLLTTSGPGIDYDRALFCD